MSLTTLGMKIFAKMDPEASHRLAINLLRFGLFPKNKFLSKDPILEQDVLVSISQILLVSLLVLIKMLRRLSQFSR